MESGVVGGGKRGDEERTLMAARDGRSESGEGCCIFGSRVFGWLTFVCWMVDLG